MDDFTDKSVQYEALYTLHLKANITGVEGWN